MQVVIIAGYVPESGAMRRLPFGVALCGAVLSLGLGACGGGNSGHPVTSSPAPAEQSTPPAARFDPPVRFAAESSWSIPSPDDYDLNPGQDKPIPAVLDGSMLYTAYPDQMTANDVTTGRLDWTAKPGTPQTDQSVPGAPRVVTLGGKRVVLAAFPVTVPGEGTVPSAPAVELMAVDATTGTVAWQDVLRVPLPHDQAEAFDYGMTVTVVGADDDAVTIALTGQRAKGVLVADPIGHRVRWFRQNYTPITASGGVVVGLDGDLFQKVIALAVADGKQKWVLPGQASMYADGQPAGPGLVSIWFKDKSKLLEIATGKERAPWPNESDAYTCAYDDASVTVCWREEQVVAFDTATAKTLWYLPKDGRVQPDVTAVWHGALYGTTSNGPVVIDARTGQDRDPAPAIAPEIVGPYGAVTEVYGELTFHLATQ